MNSASVSSTSDVSHDNTMDDFISKKGISVNKLKEITQRNSNAVPYDYNPIDCIQELV